MNCKNFYKWVETFTDSQTSVTDERCSDVELKFQLQLMSQASLILTDTCLMLNSSTLNTKFVYIFTCMLI